MPKLSIRSKITIWFTVGLMVVLGVTFAALKFAGERVLTNTLKSYLYSVVEENTEEIEYISKHNAEFSEKELADKLTDEKDVLMEYADGYILIDEDFLRVVNDVYTALYTSDGTMLYGENPLEKVTAQQPFSISHTWNMKYEGVNYDIYDRKLNLELPEDKTLWIRGIVAETEAVRQLGDVSRIMMLVIPFIALLAVLLGLLLAERSLAPVKEIEKVASEISEGDLSRRIDIGKGNDELHKLADEFNSMVGKLEKSFESEKQFTSDASHELRTPMSVIMAQCEYTLGEKRTQSEYIEALETVKRQGERMSGLINDMLDYSRMDQGEERYPLEELDISELVSDTTDGMDILHTRGITMDTDISAGLRVNGNALLLSRLVQNLVGNAYKYGKENGNILVSLYMIDHDGNRKSLKGDIIPEGARIILSVRDDGVGIAEEDQEKIFDRFYRVDSSRTKQSTGLGLAMVKRICEIHDAELELESEPGKGSTFTVIFDAI